ncbi:MAG TPA: hypothetical protein VEF04_02430 [Blastocatellia bacterium]|nr:hypothetical protein [Blastocatellia bacterium]
MSLFHKLKMEIIFWIARRQPTCRELAPWMSESLDRKLPLRKRLTLRIHFWICVWCHRYQQQLQFLQQAYRQEASLCLEETPASTATDESMRLSSEARQRIKRALSRKS